MSLSKIQQESNFETIDDFDGLNDTDKVLVEVNSRKSIANKAEDEV